MVRLLRVTALRLINESLRSRIMNMVKKKRRKWCTVAVINKVFGHLFERVAESLCLRVISKIKSPSGCNDDDGRLMGFSFSAFLSWLSFFFDAEICWFTFASDSRSALNCRDALYGGWFTFVALWSRFVLIVDDFPGVCNEILFHV